jgi:hypothetical protein
MPESAISLNHATPPKNERRFGRGQVGAETRFDSAPMAEVLERIRADAGTVMAAVGRSAHHRRFAIVSRAKDIRFLAMRALVSLAETPPSGSER